MKKAGKRIGIIILVILLIVAAYLVYVMVSYHRLPDKLTLEVNRTGNQAAFEQDRQVEVGKYYWIMTYNIGFGAYRNDYSFFMDGGRESRARSRQAVDENMRGIVAFVEDLSPDFALFQEVDTDGTRSWHIDETAYLSDVMTGCEFDEVFAQNYDSPYLFYPLIQPHGANQSGIVTLSRHPISSAVRRSLPIETGIMKLVDLDRCYSVSRIPVESGRELVLYDLHLSAYTSDGSIATEQLELLLADMQAEYEAGNWCVAGGDFNKDLLGDSSAYFGEADQDYSWAQPIPDEAFDGVDITLIAPLDESDPVPSCRNADGPYHPGQYVLTVDGFLVSANVEVREAQVIETGFAYSDHEPVEMTFVLQ